MKKRTGTPADITAHTPAVLPAGADAAVADEPAVRKPLPVPEGGWPADEFTGLSGSFVRDPFTGIRSRAPEPEPEPEPDAEPV